MNDHRQIPIIADDLPEAVVTEFVAVRLTRADAFIGAYQLTSIVELFDSKMPTESKLLLLRIAKALAAACEVRE